jgi:hypothetical protein
MLSLCTIEAMQAALASGLEPTLQRLLEHRLADTIACQLEDLTHIVVIEPGDTEDDLIEEVGFSPLLSTYDGSRYGDADFIAEWDWRECHGEWVELLHCVGNGGFAYILLIPDTEGIDPGLRKLCQHDDQTAGAECA